MDNMERFETQFKELYPGKRLLAIQLDGFSHRVIFDSGKLESAIESETYSGCAPELYDKDSRAAKLLGGTPHYCYQGNPEELIYVLPSDR